MDSGTVLPQGAGYGVGKSWPVYLVDLLTYSSLVVGERTYIAPLIPYVELTGHTPPQGSVYFSAHL